MSVVKLTPKSMKKYGLRTRPFNRWAVIDNGEIVVITYTRQEAREIDAKYFRGQS